jgi:hypothetical protein
MAKKIDFTKFKKPTQSYLKKEEVVESNPKKTERVSEKKELKAKNKIDKKGRPLTGTEPLNCVISVNFTESEVRMIKDQAGMIPITKYLRSFLQNAKVI